MPAGIHDLHDARMARPRERVRLPEQPLVHADLGLPIGARQLEGDLTSGVLVRRLVKLGNPTGRDEAPDDVSMFYEGARLERRFHVCPWQERLFLR